MGESWNRSVLSFGTVETKSRGQVPRELRDLSLFITEDKEKRLFIFPITRENEDFFAFQCIVISTAKTYTVITDMSVWIISHRRAEGQ